tara:strand:- start:991 stop:1575 length:585 start_codon:yes stop_codon:yes gene_type:complete
MQINSTLNYFKEHIDQLGGFWTPNRFMCRIIPPTLVQFRNKQYGGLSTRNLQLSCTSTSVPGRTLSTNAVMAPGPEQKYPYQDAFEDIELTFHCTINNETEKSSVLGLKEKRFFDAWLHTICNQATMLMAYSDSYKAAEFKLYLFDNKDNQIAIYKFDRAYPISVGSIELSHESEEIATFPVTISYDRWTYGDI